VSTDSVELHAFDAQLAVAQAHDDAVGGLGGNFERFRQRFPFHDERVVPCGLEILRQVAEDGLRVVVNVARLAGLLIEGVEPRLRDTSIQSGTEIL